MRVGVISDSHVGGDGRGPPALVDVVAFGDTHEELVLRHAGVLFVNPGSPTFQGLSHGRHELGTLAILEVVDGRVSVELVKLEGARRP